MSRRCDLTGKGVMVGHKVSHSNIKTKRRFLPNLLNVTLMSDALGRSFKMRVSANALKSSPHLLLVQRPSSHASFARPEGQAVVCGGACAEADASKAMPSAGTSPSAATARKKCISWRRRA